MTRLGEIELQKYYDGKREYDDSLMVLESLAYGPETVGAARIGTNSLIKDSETDIIYYNDWIKMVRKSIKDGYVSTFKYENVDEHL